MFGILPLVRSPYFARLAGAAALLAGMGLTAIAPAHAAVTPAFSTNRFHVDSVGATSLFVNRGGAYYVVNVSPTASLHRRFYGAFSRSDLHEIQAGDSVQMSYQANGHGVLTAYMVQDYSLQIAHSEIKGWVSWVGPARDRFTLAITQAFGGSLAAFHAGETITIATSNPSSIPVTYAQGGPSCGNASCMTPGIYLELYGLSDAPNRDLRDPRAIVQVLPGAGQVVHALTD